MISHVTIMNFLIYDVRRMAFHLCGILSKAIKSTLILKEHQMNPN